MSAGERSNVQDRLSTSSLDDPRLGANLRKETHIDRFAPMQKPYRRKSDLSADAAGQGFNLNLPEIIDCGGGGEQRIVFSGSRERAAAVGGGARARDSG